MIYALVPLCQCTRHLFLVLFTIEIILKLTGLGFRKFFYGDEATDQLGAFNAIDFIAVTGSLISTIPALGSASGSNASPLFLVLRMFRLIRYVCVCVCVCVRACSGL